MSPSNRRELRNIRRNNPKIVFGRDGTYVHSGRRATGGRKPPKKGCALLALGALAAWARGRGLA